MTGSVSWSDIPEVALNLVFLNAGLRFLDSFSAVSWQWRRMSDRDGFWKGMVQREFGYMSNVLPEHIKSWKALARSLHFQKVYLVELTSNTPRELTFRDSAGDISHPRGVLHLTMSKLVDCMEGKMTEIYVYVCVMASNELLLWTSMDIASPIDVVEAASNYLAPFRGKHVVSHAVQEVSGALVSTITGKLYESSVWGRSLDGDFMANFEEVSFACEGEIISFALGCSGVRVAALSTGVVYVWGKVFGSLYEQVGVHPQSLFGLEDDSTRIVPNGQMVAVENPAELVFDGLGEDDCIVQLVAGSAHFLARSRNGELWVWGFNGCDLTGAPVKLASSPTKVSCPRISAVHNAHMMETSDGRLLAYSEFVCGGSSHPIWTPMYNVQYDEHGGPALPNPWPWKQGNLGAVQAHAREIAEMPLSASVELSAGCVGYTRHSDGCIRIHIYSDDECRNSREPLLVLPMFDVGPEVAFGANGNMYYGAGGQVVVKDVRRAHMRDQFYLVDLPSLGIPMGGSLTVEKPCGGWLLAVVLSTMG